MLITPITPINSEIFTLTNGLKTLQNQPIRTKNNFLTHEHL